jgi:isocitrate dehydrogenase
MQSTYKTVTIAKGDGIGPEILDSVLEILSASGARLQFEEIELGEKLYLKGYKSGMKPDSWEKIRRNRILLKAPVTTPQGGGVKSLNVTMRKTLGLYANVRPCMSYHPFVRTKHPEMDVVIVRENEEDTYGGIEHRQTYEVYQCLKLITLPGSERIVRYAFEYARANNRKKVTCFTKDNIMKLTDGLFHDIFKKVAQEYPDIESENLIVDIGTARLADTPERFDVIVMPNLYGDIVSDVAAQISGSVGLAGSANVGTKCAMFEAIHGSAPDIAGKNIANPSGLLRAAEMMLIHLGQQDVAELIHNAWLKTLEDGIHTPDIYHPGVSKKQATRSSFTKAVIDRLGQQPVHLKPAKYPEKSDPLNVELKYSRGIEKPSNVVKRELRGVDVFVYWEPDHPDILAGLLKRGLNGTFKLSMFTNRGTKVWPDGMDETFCTDHWRCRFEPVNGGISQRDIINLMESLNNENIDIIKTENLYAFNGSRAYSLGQGE